MTAGSVCCALESEYFTVHQQQALPSSISGSSCKYSACATLWQCRVSGTTCMSKKKKKNHRRAIIVMKNCSVGYCLFLCEKEGFCIVLPLCCWACCERRGFRAGMCLNKCRLCTIYSYLTAICVRERTLPMPVLIPDRGCFHQPLCCMIPG